MPARAPAIAIAAERVGQYILVIRPHRVLLDEDLAALYGVETRVLLQAVKRNSERFPPDFMFEVSTVEWVALRSQSVTSKSGRGGRRYAPYACKCGDCSMPTSPWRASLIVSNDSILSAIRQLMKPPNARKRGIGFTADLKD